MSVHVLIDMSAKNGLFGEMPRCGVRGECNIAFLQNPFFFYPKSAIINSEEKLQGG